MSAPLPPLEPRRRSEGLPPLAERPRRPVGLPPLAERRPPRGGLPPLGGAPAADAPPPSPAAPRRRPGRRSLSAVAVALAVLAAGAVGGLSSRLLDEEPARPAAIETPASVSGAAVSPSGAHPELADAVSRVAPTVVHVQTDTGSQGSGVVLEPSGLIVTNHHVIAGAFRVSVTTVDERRVPATVVRSDEGQDLAILRPDGPVGRGAELAEEPGSGLRPGDTVFAIGSPFGLQNTVTAGVVSHAQRQDERGVPMIQIDAPINPGNSGGGLFDLSGRLVGIPTSILAPIPGNVGIGFAVPVSRVRDLLAGAP